MVFRQFAILLFAFGLLSAAASSSSSSTSSAIASEISTTAASEISTTAASESSTNDSEVSTTAAEETTTIAQGSANNDQASQNPVATTTTAQAPTPAYEQAVSFNVDNISAFANAFDVEDFKNKVVEDGSTMNVEVSVAVKLAFTASYPSDTVAKTQVAQKLGISEDNVEVAEVTTRRLKSSTRRLSDKQFSVTATATLENAAAVTQAVAQVPGSDGVETEVVVTVKIFATSGTPLPKPTLRLESAAGDLTGVDASSITVTAMTGEDMPDEAATQTSSNSVLPWVFTAGLVGIVALF